MKKLISKIFSVITIMMMCAGVIGCAGSGQSLAGKTDTESTDRAYKEVADEKENTDSKDKNSIVIYFSCTGNTEKVAHNISDILGADIYKIVPKYEYTSDDRNYSNSSSRATREQNDENARPEIGSEKKDLSKYDIV